MSHRSQFFQLGHIIRSLHLLCAKCFITLCMLYSKECKSSERFSNRPRGTQPGALRYCVPWPTLHCLFCRCSGYTFALASLLCIPGALIKLLQLFPFLAPLPLGTVTRAHAARDPSGSYTCVTWSWFWPLTVQPLTDASRVTVPSLCREVNPEPVREDRLWRRCSPSPAGMCRSVSRCVPLSGGSAPSPCI